MAQEIKEKANEIINNTSHVIIEDAEVAVDKTQEYTDLAISFMSEYGMKIIGALLIFIIGKWAARTITKIVVAVMRKNKIDETLVSFIESIIYIILLIVVVLASLNALGVQTTSFVAILGAAGLAIGLALQGTLGNVGSGVLLISFRPFKVGDFVTVGGETGTVASISIFATTLHTLDNKVVTVPNSGVTNGNITNFSAKEIRRIDLTFGIGYGDDLRKAKTVLEDIMKDDERVLSDPEPFVGVLELGDSSVNFVFRPWVQSDDYWDVYFDMHEKVKLAFDEQGISIPFPQMDVHLNKVGD
jgi:small conductance mechanosensitive channel